MIGSNEYINKKEALKYFKTILNSYNVGQVLNTKDLEQTMSLIKIHPKAKEKIGDGIKTIKVSQTKYNSKSFELIRNNGSTECFSYIKCINTPQTSFSKFSEACREAIQDDLREVKLSYFKRFAKNGKVKCQESGQFTSYGHLNVDHRQPNTFSVIVDRFIEVKNIDIDNLQYLKINGAPDKFKNIKLNKEFRIYHSIKANLRVVQEDLNISRSFQARIKRQKKDLLVNLKTTKT